MLAGLPKVHHGHENGQCVAVVDMDKNYTPRDIEGRSIWCPHCIMGILVGTPKDERMAGLSEAVTTLHHGHHIEQCPPVHQVSQKTSESKTYKLDEKSARYESWA